MGREWKVGDKVKNIMNPGDTVIYLGPNPDNKELFIGKDKFGLTYDKCIKERFVLEEEYYAE